MAISAYLIAGYIQASGFMATFTAGLISGNPQLFRLHISEETHSTVSHFIEHLTLIMRTLIFMLLGTQVDFSILNQYWKQGVLIVLIFMFIARPLASYSVLCQIERQDGHGMKSSLCFGFMKLVSSPLHFLG